MRYVDNWLNAHHFHHEDVDEFEEILKKFWEAVLLITLCAMIIYTVLVLIAPELAFKISSYFV